MDGVSWAIFACIGAFVYRLYSKNPKQFVENWGRFVENLNSLFDPGGREAAEDDGKGKDSDKGPDVAIRGQRRLSVGTTGADKFLKPSKSGAAVQEDQNLKESASARGEEAQDKKIAQTPGKYKSKKKGQEADQTGSQNGSESEDDGKVKETSPSLRDVEEEGNPPATNAESDNGKVAEKPSSGKGESKKSKAKSGASPKGKGKAKPAVTSSDVQEEEITEQAQDRSAKKANGGKNDKREKNSSSKKDAGDAVIDGPSSDTDSHLSTRKPKGNAGEETKGTPVATSSKKTAQKVRKSSRAPAAEAIAAVNSDSGSEQELRDARGNPDADAEADRSSGATEKAKKGASPAPNKLSREEPVATRPATVDKSDTESVPDDAAARPSGNGTRAPARGWIDTTRRRRPVPDRLPKDPVDKSDCDSDTSLNVSSTPSDHSRQRDRRSRNDKASQKWQNEWENSDTAVDSSDDTALESAASPRSKGSYRTGAARKAKKGRGYIASSDIEDDQSIRGGRRSTREYPKGTSSVGTLFPSSPSLRSLPAFQGKGRVRGEPKRNDKTQDRNGDENKQNDGVNRYNQDDVHENDTGDSDDSYDSLYPLGLPRATPRPRSSAKDTAKATSIPVPSTSKTPETNGSKSKREKNVSGLAATVESDRGDGVEGAGAEGSLTTSYRRAESPSAAEAAQAAVARTSGRTGEPSRRRPKTTKPGNLEESNAGSEADTESSPPYMDDAARKEQRKARDSSRHPSLPPYFDDRNMSDTNQGRQKGNEGDTTRKTKRDQNPQGADPATDDASDSQSEQDRSQRGKRTADRSSSPEAQQDQRSSSPVPASSPSRNTNMADMGHPQRPPNPESKTKTGNNMDQRGADSGDESKSQRPRRDRNKDEKGNPLPLFSPPKEPIRKEEVPQRDTPEEGDPSIRKRRRERPPPRSKQQSDNEETLNRQQQAEIDLADVPITEEAKQGLEKSEKKNGASSPTIRVPRTRRKRPQGTTDHPGADVESASEDEDMKTYYAEDAKGGAVNNQDTPVDPEAAVRPDHRSPEKSEDTSEKPRHQSKKERKQAKKEAKEARAKERAANHDSERGAAAPEPPKGFWRGLKDAFRNARQHKTKSFVCFLLGIGYVIATGYGNEYGRTTPAVKSSASSLSARQFASTGLEDSVSGAVKSAKEQLGSVDVSPTAPQQNLLAISILWHLVIQFTIVLLISDIIAPPAPKLAPTPDGKEPAPKKSRWRRSKDSYSSGYHSIRDPISNAWHMARRASKWTYIRLGLISFLGLTMILVARQLSSLAHIAANPTAGPWTDWPDVTVLHHSLQANVSQLGDGGRILAASFGFWGITMTAFVYCLSSLADRPAAPPVDEEMAVVEKEEEKKVAEK